MKPEFYKMDFRAWNVGTVDLSLEQEAAYLRLCHAMYDARGPVPESTRLLQGLFRCGNVKAAALVNQLVAAGKILRTEDGKLINPRVTAELAGREAVSEVRRAAGGNGGRARRVTAECDASETEVTAQCTPSEAEVNTECAPSEMAVSPAKSLKNCGAGQAIASASESREEKRREDSTPIVPKGTQAGFERFRAAYPRKHVSFPTQQARKRYDQAIKGGATHDEIEAGAKAYAAEQIRIGRIGTEYVKAADAWLHQRRWLDFAQQDTEPLGTSAAKLSPEQDRRHRLRLAKDHFRDEWRQGTDEQYRPSSADCTTPPEIIEEARASVAAERLVARSPQPANAA